MASAEYDFGDTFFLANTLAGFPGPIEFRAAVHYPADLSGGPFPLILFLHGRHTTCFLGTFAALQWPCTSGRSPIPSYRGYDYAGQLLASHGYVVVSISANGISARDNSIPDVGMLARAQLVQKHLDLWHTFHTIGGAPFGTQFVGKVDLTRVGTMGHSRGGEGIVRSALFNAAQPAPYGIRALLPLAPTDFNRFVVNGIPLKVDLPYCDGDVSDLQGIHFFDDARYSLAGDPAAKYTVLFRGANHNYFNTVWTPGLFSAGTADDWTAFMAGGSSDPHCGTVAGNQRLTPAQQRAAGAAYMAAFFRAYLGGEAQYESLLRGDDDPPASALTNDLVVSYHPPDDPLLRRDVNRLLESANLSTNTLGGSVSQFGLTPFDLCGGPSPQPQHCLSVGTARQPHTTPSARSSARGLSQLRFGWNDVTASYTNDLPQGSWDVSRYAMLQFRTALNHQDARNAVGQPQDFSIRLSDGAGHAASVSVSAWSQALSYPPGSIPNSTLPKLILNTVRLPLTAFVGVNLTDVHTVEFRFDRTVQGAVLVSDIAFADVGAGGDTVAPDTTITSSVNGTGSTVASGSLTSSTSMTLEFTGTDDAGIERFECSLDGAAFTTCTSPTTVTGLTSGDHAFSVHAVDTSGNVDPTPATFTWTVDAIPPDTTITFSVDGNGAAVEGGGVTGSASMTFQFTGTDNVLVAGFECSLDGAAFSACTSPALQGPLTGGSHTFAVSAVDTAGNDDPTPASFTWTVHAPPPADRAPVCSAAVATSASMFPIDHGLRPVTITNVTDPDGDVLRTTVTAICQDEAPNFENIPAYAIDGSGVGSASASVRAEFSGSRSQPSNGRVYHIYFTADDGKGGMCSGEVKIGVPTSANGTAIDGGPVYNSTAPNNAACTIPQ